MNLRDILTAVEDVLSEKRYQHTLRVMDTAIELAKLYNESVDRTKTAALLHDYAKCFTVSELEFYIHKYQLPKELTYYHHELWHGPVASEIIKEKFGIKDPDIINAVRYHTTGRTQMTKLEYIIFVADYIEPGRDFEGVEEVRILAKKSIEQAARKAMQNTIIYLMKQDNTIYPDSFLAYNYVTAYLKGR